MPAAAEEAIRITSANLALYAAFQNELRMHLTELIEMTRRYPVEIEFKGLRFVFDSEKDIREAIDMIEARINTHRATHPGVSPA